jgi:hypothetical protein
MALERYALPARYSLVVSIQTPPTHVDLYAAVAQKIPVANAVAVGTKARPVGQAHSS